MDRDPDALHRDASRVRGTCVRLKDKVATLEERLGAVRPESARPQAEQALADKREFIVSPKQWEAFLEVLDRPARVNPKLVQLFPNSRVSPQASTQ